MDEKHEELKGARGWATSHRRSVSWLLYLSGEQHSGGALRGYCRDVAGAGIVGAHDGNLQVGWLASTAEDSAGDTAAGAAAQTFSEPVVMD